VRYIARFRGARGRSDEFSEFFSGKAATMRVYFCCAGCIPKFKEHPAKYIKQMADEGIKLAEAPKSK